MTEKEFFAKLDESIASAENGNCDEMGANESGEEFLKRILCRRNLVSQNNPRA